MECLETHIPYNSRRDVFTLWYVTDIHAGARACDEELLGNVIAQIKADKKALWWLGGDYCDYIPVQDSKRWDPGSVADWIGVADLDDLPRVQSAWLAEKLKPIAGQCLGVGIGNHDEMIRQHHSQDVHQIMLGLLNGYLPVKAPRIRSIGYSAFHVLRFHRGTTGVDGPTASLTCYLHHGYFGGRLKGSKALGLERVFAYYDCDVFFTGHNHDRLAFKTVAMRPMISEKGATYKARNRAAVNCGTFLRTLSQPGETPTYSEAKGYFPTALGPVPVTFEPDSFALSIIQ
jgi:hypothetical protein